MKGSVIVTQGTAPPPQGLLHHHSVITVMVRTSARRSRGRTLSNVTAPGGPRSSSPERCGSSSHLARCSAQSPTGKNPAVKRSWCSSPEPSAWMSLCQVFITKSIAIQLELAYSPFRSRRPAFTSRPARWRSTSTSHKEGHHRVSGPFCHHGCRSSFVN